MNLFVFALTAKSDQHTPSERFVDRARKQKHEKQSLEHARHTLATTSPEQNIAANTAQKEHAESRTATSPRERDARAPVTGADSEGLEQPILLSESLKNNALRKDARSLQSSTRRKGQPAMPTNADLIGMATL